MKKILVAGAGGFIGGFLTKKLLEEGNQLVCADIKPIDQWYQVSDCLNFDNTDLKLLEKCDKVCDGVDEIYNLAADMGGMGFIENNKALCMLSVLINTHLLKSAKQHNVQRYFYSSSACVYCASKQQDTNNPGLKEDDAYPAMPEDGYGWEKLFSERMCRHYMEDFGLECRVARFHNIMGTHGTYKGGREKAPAAICRKIAAAKALGVHEIEIWGDGKQTRSFTYIDDCITGIRKLMDSEVRFPLNIGSSEMVSVDQLVDMVEEIAGIKCKRIYNLNAPKGVRGRSSDNTIIKQLFDGWEPRTRLADGLNVLYHWIEEQETKNDERFNQ
jgi:nucleoside-diphosphate-sugar epimerase